MIRTLIVDDDPFVRMSLQTILEAQDDVEVCALGADGDEAVELFERERPDVLLMDIQMPELDGIEATRRIRAFLPDIPIIAMTAHTMKGDAEKCLEAGMQDHIAKPIDPETLFAALQWARG